MKKTNYFQYVGVESVGFPWYSDGNHSIGLGGEGGAWVRIVIRDHT